MNIELFPSAGEGEPGMETYYFEVPLGASGAVGTIVRQRGLQKPIGIVRTGTGVYVFTLEDGVQAICDWNFDIIAAVPTNTAAGNWPRVTARTQNAITITVLNSGGSAAADPNTGDVLIGSITVKNSNA